MESFATPYPLFFSDGDQEVDKGQIGIHSVLQFKRFQAQLSRLIGLPANQLSAVFVCRRSSEKRQKLPIGENTNFNIILNQHNPMKEKDCYFLVSLKKSKKERKGSRRRSAEAESIDDDDSTSSRGDASPASQRPGKDSDESFASFEASSPNSVLDQQHLEPPKREEPLVAPKITGDGDNPVSVSVRPVSSSPPVSRIGGQLLSRGAPAPEQAKFGVIGSGKAQEVVSQARFKDPVIRMNGGVPDGINVRLLSNSNSRVMSSSSSSHQQQVQEIHHLQQQQRLSLSLSSLQRLARGSEHFCPDCASYQERNIRPPPFHCCINDRITSGFNGPSPAGPIERPVKRQVKAAA